MGKYTQVPVDLVNNLQLNAGMIVETFNPATGVYSNIIGATSGGTTINATPQYLDLGDGIDGVPANTAELKRVDRIDITMSGTLVEVGTTALSPVFGVDTVVSATSTSGGTLSKINLLNRITPSSYSMPSQLWWVGDFSGINTGDNAGFIAIKMKNVTNTSGLSLKTSDKEKGQWAFSFAAHYSINNIDEVPVEIYIFQPSSHIELLPVSITIEEDAVATLTAVSTASNLVWSTSDDDVVTVDAGVITGVAAGEADVYVQVGTQTATKSNACHVTVVAASN